MQGRITAGHTDRGGGIKRWRSGGQVQGGRALSHRTLGGQATQQEAEQVHPVAEEGVGHHSIQNLLTRGGNRDACRACA